MQPSPAERARTAMWISPTLEIAAAGGVVATVAAHVTDDSGRPMLTVDRRSPLAELLAGMRGPVPMVVHAAALRPIQGPDRVRTRVELRGFLTIVRRPAEHIAAALRWASTRTAERPPFKPGCLMLRGEVLAINIDGLQVDPDAYAAAAPDPLVDHETAILEELLRNRTADIIEICGLLEPELLAEATEIAPSGLDRHGLTVWLSGPERVCEIRLPFAMPVDRLHDLPAAMGLLLDGVRRP